MHRLALVMWVLIAACGTDRPTQDDVDDGDAPPGDSDCGQTALGCPSDDAPTDNAPADDCIDVDGDGYGARCFRGEDCDDSLATGAACITDCLALYVDADGDGLGAGTPVTSCVIIEGHVLEGGDCAPSDPLHRSDCGVCVDTDGDGRGPGCDYGDDDCDPDDPDVWRLCYSCSDMDRDGAFAGCDAYVRRAYDCDERDPTTGGTRVELPDTGVDENCDSAPEPKAVDGNGVYVSASTCGAQELGTKAAPFCTMGAAFAATTSAATPIFVATGQYAMPATVQHERVFGRYTTDWSSRTGVTRFVLGAFNPGMTLDDVVFQGGDFYYENDCDNCNALFVSSGGAQLLDVQIFHQNTQNDCSTISVETGELLLGRVRAETGTACTNHRVIFQNSGSTLVWKSTLRAGKEGNADQHPTTFWGGGKLLIAESQLIATGAVAASVRAFAGADVAIHHSAMRGIESNGAALRIETSRIHASPVAVTVTAGTTDIFHSVVGSSGAGATAVQIASTSPARIINNVFEVASSVLSVGVSAAVEGTQVTVRSNDFQIASDGSVCPALAGGVCVASLSDVAACAWDGCVSGEDNFVSTDCNVQFAMILTPCIRDDVGFDLDGALLWPYDERHKPIGATSYGWDVGPISYAPPQED